MRLRSGVGKAYSVQESSPPQFIEEALVFLSLWRKPWCYSFWGVEHFARLLLCFVPPEEVVLILQQGGPKGRGAYSDFT